MEQGKLDPPAAVNAEPARSTVAALGGPRRWFGSFVCSRYGLGLVLIVLVAIIWVAASLWIQWIFGSLNFDKPFFLTYFNTAGFMLWNLGYLIPQTGWSRTPWRHLEAESESSDGEECEPGQPEEGYAALPIPASTNGGGLTHLTHAPPEAPSGEPTAVPCRKDRKARRPYSVQELFHAAMLFCPLWFLANCLFNYSLSRTSVASNTILSTTSSIWTLLISRWLIKDPIHAIKVLAIGMSVGGTVMVALSDDRHHRHHKVLSNGTVVSASSSGSSSSSSGSGTDSVSGDLLALASAAFYAGYTTVLRWCLPDDRRYSMGQAFGAVGVINTVLMWPGFLLLNYFGVERFEWPSWSVFWPLVLNTLIGTNLSDVLWARSVILTSPLIATLGLCLTTPFAMLADAIFQHETFSGLYIFGAFIVTAGFVVANAPLRRCGPSC